MKTSDKLLLGAGGAVLLAVVVLLLIVRLVVSGHLAGEYGHEPVGKVLPGGNVNIRVGSGSQGPRASVDFPVLEFSEVEAKGPFDFRVRQSQTPGLTLSAPESLLEKVRITQKNQVIHVHWLPGAWLGSPKVTVELATPVVRRFRLRGLTTLFLEGFAVDPLELDLGGDSRVTASNASIRSLIVEARGQNEVLLFGNPVGNANLDLEGGFRVELTMDGGVLEGTADGAGQVVYEGRVVENRLAASGSARVLRR
ncbi:MAG: GIN domain-containing protein [Desulfatibacillaceae bacterium]